MLSFCDSCANMLFVLCPLQEPTRSASVSWARLDVFVLLCRNQAPQVVLSCFCFSLTTRFGLYMCLDMDVFVRTQADVTTPTNSIHSLSAEPGSTWVFKDIGFVTSTSLYLVRFCACVLFCGRERELVCVVHLFKFRTFSAWALLHLTTCPWTTYQDHCIFLQKMAQINNLDQRTPIFMWFELALFELLCDLHMQATWIGIVSGTRSYEQNPRWHIWTSANQKRTAPNLSQSEESSPDLCWKPSKNC